MESLESRKAEIRDRIEEGVEIVQDLKDERSNLNARRDQALEQDQAELSSAHEKYVRGQLKQRPVAYTANWDAVESRAVAMPKLIDAAQLEVAKARLDLVLLEGAQALAEEQAPREKLERIQDEVAQLERERLEAEQDVTSVRRRAEATMQEEFAYRGEIHRLEEAVSARTRVASNFGVVVG
jgi:multidrug efflux pump subunit AcrA (membrane-fusion protein)